MGTLSKNSKQKQQQHEEQQQEEERKKQTSKQPKPDEVEENENISSRNETTFKRSAFAAAANTRGDKRHKTATRTKDSNNSRTRTIEEWYDLLQPFFYDKNNNNNNNNEHSGARYLTLSSSSSLSTSSSTTALMQVWSQLQELHVVQLQQQQHQSDASAPTAATTSLLLRNSVKWKQGCQVLAHLVCDLVREGTHPIDILSEFFMSHPLVPTDSQHDDQNETKPGPSNETETESKVTQEPQPQACWNHVVETICTQIILPPSPQSPDHDDNDNNMDNDDPAEPIMIPWSLWTMVTHFCTIVWSVAQTQTAFQTSALWYHLGGPTTTITATTSKSEPVLLLDYLPEHRRQLERKRRGLDSDVPHKSDNNNNNKGVPSPSPPFVVTLVQRLLHLMQGELLTLKAKIATTTFPNSEEEVGEEEIVITDQEQEERIENQQEHEQLQAWIFFHRACELLIDLLSSPPFSSSSSSSSSSGITHAVSSSLPCWYDLALYLDALHVCQHGRLHIGTSIYSRANENMLLAQQLLERIDKLVKLQQQLFVPPQADPTSLVVGTQRQPHHAINMYHQRASTLQKLCHRYYPDQLSDLIFAGVGLLCSHQQSSFLHKK